MVWVRDAEGSITGTSSIVTDRHVLTCAYIVAVALGALREDAEPPAGKPSDSSSTALLTHSSRRFP